MTSEVSSRVIHCNTLMNRHNIPNMTAEVAEFKMCEHFKSIATLISKKQTKTNNQIKILPKRLPWRNVDWTTCATAAAYNVWLIFKVCHPILVNHFTHFSNTAAINSMRYKQQGTFVLLQLYKKKRSDIHCTWNVPILWTDMIGTYKESLDKGILKDPK